ncbi:PA14 domain-containing protein [Hymenobacter terrenus]|uniref:PA14 domain-containing protein n=1 Tax=Hymenobacter terrenus TaxID=1629124 RepID=UPI0006973404|nr:PA14 domain-containing protein [Hymenobacter terrenus]
MKQPFFFLLLGLGSLSTAHATNYYVSANAGKDTNRGTESSPLKTIQAAANKTVPGDVVYVRAGTYKNAYAGAAVEIKRSGAPGKWIVFRNYPGEKPLLQFTSWQGFNIQNNVSYIEINGFRIQGNNRNVTLAAALNQPSGCAKNGVGTPDGRYNGNGIASTGGSRAGSKNPHHLRYLNNEIFECGGAGISAIRSDYVTMENNVIYNTSWYTRYATSGISIYQSWNYDKAAGYHNIVRGNRLFGNRLLVPWWRGGSFGCMGITDGNGIIIDDTRNTQNGSKLGAYTARTLVANNLVVNNGGAGVQVYKSDHIDVINNTAYHNSQSTEINNGEIYANASTDVLIQNNILVAAPGEKVFGKASTTDNVKYVNNLFFGGSITRNTSNNTLTSTGVGTTSSADGTKPPTSVTIPVGTNLVADPQFVNPTLDWKTANFTLKATSPAINAGLNNKLSPTDLAGNPRVSGGTSGIVDLGAYESTTTTTTPQPPTTTLRPAENPTNIAAGLNYNYNQGTWNKLPDFEQLPALRTGTVTTFDLSSANQADNFAFHFYGYINVPADGQYTFATKSDDGSKLYIGNTLVVDNDGLHDIVEKSGTIGLKAGKHFIAVDYFEATGGNTLQVFFQGPGLAKQLVPASALFRKDYSASAYGAKTAASKTAVEPVEAYPNPTAGRTTLRYELPQAGPVRLEVLNSQGRVVAVLVNGQQSAGAQEAVFDAPARQGISLYYVRLTTPAGTSSSRLTVNN